MGSHLHRRCQLRVTKPISPQPVSAELLFQMDLARSTQQPSNLATASHCERCIQLRDISYCAAISNQRPQHNCY